MRRGGRGGARLVRDAHFPGDSKPPAQGFRADSVVTYGMSPRNTVTYSSIAEDSCVVAVQRELKTFSGRKVESQELRVPEGCTLICCWPSQPPRSVWGAVERIILTFQNGTYTFHK